MSGRFHRGGGARTAVRSLGCPCRLVASYVGTFLQLHIGGEGVVQVVSLAIGHAVPLLHTHVGTRIEAWRGGWFVKIGAAQHADAEVELAISEGDLSTAVSGIENLGSPGWWKLCEEELKQMFAVCRMGAGQVFVESEPPGAEHAPHPHGKRQ